MVIFLSFLVMLRTPQWCSSEVLLYLAVGSRLWGGEQCHFHLFSPYMCQF